MKIGFNCSSLDLLHAYSSSELRERTANLENIKNDLTVIASPQYSPALIKMPSNVIS